MHLFWARRDSESLWHHSAIQWTQGESVQSGVRAVQHIHDLSLNEINILRHFAEYFKLHERIVQTFRCRNKEPGIGNLKISFIY